MSNRLVQIILKLFAFIMIFFLILDNFTFAQGYYSSIGDRENIGIYGGPASDLSFSLNNRLFASVQWCINLRMVLS